MPEKPWPKMEKSSFFSVITHVMEKSSAMRMTMASASPRKRARGCWSFGSLSTRMLMKTMLSMPSTISSTLRVSRAIQASGWLIHEKSNNGRAASECHAPRE